MNELQRKLARRKQLNGETEEITSVKAELTNNRQDDKFSPQSKPTTTSTPSADAPSNSHPMRSASPRRILPPAVSISSQISNQNALLAQDCGGEVDDSEWDDNANAATEDRKEVSGDENHLTIESTDVLSMVDTCLEENGTFAGGSNAGVDIYIEPGYGERVEGEEIVDIAEVVEVLEAVEVAEVAEAESFEASRSSSSKDIRENPPRENNASNEGNRNKDEDGNSVSLGAELNESIDAHCGIECKIENVEANAEIGMDVGAGSEVGVWNQYDSSGKEARIDEQENNMEVTIKNDDDVVCENHLTIESTDVLSMVDTCLEENGTFAGGSNAGVDIYIEPGYGERVEGEEIVDIAEVVEVLEAVEVAEVAEAESFEASRSSSSKDIRENPPREDNANVEGNDVNEGATESAVDAQEDVPSVKDDFDELKDFFGRDGDLFLPGLGMDLGEIKITRVGSIKEKKTRRGSGGLFGGMDTDSFPEYPGSEPPSGSMDTGIWSRMRNRYNINLFADELSAGTFGSTEDEIVSQENAEAKLNLLLHASDSDLSLTSQEVVTEEEDKKLFDKLNKLPSEPSSSVFSGYEVNTFLSSVESAAKLEERQIESAKHRHQKLLDLGLFGGDFDVNESDSLSTDVRNDSSITPSKSPDKSKNKTLFDGSNNLDFSGERGQSHIGMQATYQDFLSTFMQPECEPIVNALRLFLSSIMGPKGDGTPPETSPKKPSSKGRKKSTPDYMFLGDKNLDTRFNDFLDTMVETLPKFKFWETSMPEQLMFARDCLERYMTGKIYTVAYRFTEVPEEDEALSYRTQLLSFLTPEALDIKLELRNDMIWALAADQLQKINSFTTPADKIKCIVECASILFRTLNMARVKSESAEEMSNSAPGCDDFLPLFIWVVLQANVPKLCSNCEYIQAFHNKEHLMTKAGYCLVNLRSAIEFIMHVDAGDLTIDAQEFEKNLNEAECRLQR